MARDRTGHAIRSFLGMKVLEGGPLAKGTKLFRDGQEVGVVTSSCHSPRLGRAGRAGLPEVEAPRARHEAGSRDTKPSRSRVRVATGAGERPERDRSRIRSRSAASPDSAR